MKAAVFDAPGGPEVLHVAEVPDPKVLPKNILIKVKAISIEGGDTVWRSTKTDGGPNYVVGYAAAGEVIELGSEATKYKKGDLVTAFNFAGSHAELFSVPENYAFPVPDGMDIGTAACIPIGPGTAAFAMQKLGDKAGKDKRVLVLGATGGVGVAAVQLASLNGAHVIGTGRSENSLKGLKEYGLHDYAIADASTSVSQQINDKFGPVHSIIDNVGGSALLDALDSLKGEGAAALIGVLKGLDTDIKLHQVLFKRQTLIGIFLGGTFADPDAVSEAEKAVQHAIDLTHSGNLKVPIGKKFHGLEQVRDAHAFSGEHGSFGRAVVYL